MCILCLLQEHVEKSEEMELVTTEVGMVDPILFVRMKRAENEMEHIKSNMHDDVWLFKQQGMSEAEMTKNLKRCLRGSFL